MIPSWLHLLSIFALATGAVCAAGIAIDLLRRPQHMAIMNIVWPIAALFGTGATVWLYVRYGRLAAEQNVEQARRQGKDPPQQRLTPFAVMVAKGSAHCGAGCTLGDVCAEFLALGVPTVAVWFGWKSIFPDTPAGKIYAVWVLDYLLAFAFGIAFQYFTIKPMRDLSPGQGLLQAIKADVLSLTAWQVGMYGFMAFAQFVLFRRVWNHPIHPDMPEFWFMMQLAMLLGFATSYPINWWLIRRGIKEKM